MNAPSRYSARIAAVNTSFLRISATRNEFRIVESTPPLLLDELDGAPGALDRLAGALGDLVDDDGELLRELAAAEHLDRDVALLRQAGVAQRLEVDRRPVGGAGIEIAQVPS